MLAERQPINIWYKLVYCKKVSGRRKVWAWRRRECRREWRPSMRDVERCMHNGIKLRHKRTKPTRKRFFSSSLYSEKRFWMYSAEQRNAKEARTGKISANDQVVVQVVVVVVVVRCSHNFRLYTWDCWPQNLLVVVGMRMTKPVWTETKVN